LAIGGFLLILGASALVRYVIMPRRLIQHARQMPGTTGNRVIMVDERGLRHQGEGPEQRFPKTAIHRLVLHKAHLFILLKPTGCLMLPLAWIRPPATIEEVVKRLAGRDDA
jgi:hypothetical protein